MRTKSFTVEINTENSAFDGSGLEQELARIMREIAYNLEGGATQWGLDFRIYDSNGNRVGRFYTKST